MKKDLPVNIVEDISIAVVLENSAPNNISWTVYLVNEKNVALTNVLVSSKGYGEKDGREVKTGSGIIVKKNIFESNFISSLNLNVFLNSLHVLAIIKIKIIFINSLG